MFIILYIVLKPTTVDNCEVVNTQSQIEKKYDGLCTYFGPNNLGQSLKKYW